MTNKEAASTQKKKSTAIESKQDKGFDPVTFMKGTKQELDKVVWPSRQQLISESVAVILMVILSASLIYLVNGLFRWVSGQVFG